MAGQRRFGSVKGQDPPNKGRKFPAEPLTRDEADALISAALRAPRLGIRNAALLAVMYRGGLRIAEALALRSSDVDLDRKTARVLHGKGDKARLVHIGAGACELITRWQVERIRLGAARGPLFCTRTGGQLSDRYVRMMMKRLALSAGIDKRAHPHGLRHSHAMELAYNGTPVNVISKQLGHSSVAVTSIYLDHIAAPDVAMWIDRLDWSPP